MEEIMETELEGACRESETCRGCGKGKEKGLILCWDCFKYRPNRFKYSELTLEAWLAKYGV